MDLSPEEQSFFEAGDAFDENEDSTAQRDGGQSPSAQESSDRYRHRGRRRARSPLPRRLRRKLRRSGWQKTIVSVVLTLAGIWAGYRASMYMVNRDLPSPDEIGVEARGR